MREGWSSATSSSGHHFALWIILRHPLPANSLDTHNILVRTYTSGYDSLLFILYLISAVCLVGAAIITSGEFGSSQNYSLFDNITCSDTASEYSLGRCTVNVGTCLSTCTNSIGIRCFGMFMSVVKLPVHCVRRCEKLYTTTLACMLNST